MDKNKLLKMTAILAAVVIIASGLSKFMQRGSMSLSEYAKQQNNQTDTPGSPSPTPPALSPNPQESPAPASTAPGPEATSQPPSPSPDTPPATASPEPSLLTGASLNGDSQLEERVTLEENFYYEPLSAQLGRYITGVSYPAFEEDTESTTPEITLEELRYVHILHYDFDATLREGELICNEYIAQDLLEIFYELYRNEYQLEKVLLIDEYDGDDTASMEDNNTSCFNYRVVAGSTALSRHALGLAVDINPLYNPYIAYTTNGEGNVLPASASAYADRSVNFPYKIDENDLCYKLFIQHGFTWGGNWNNVKDYQHFQKAKNN